MQLRMELLGHTVLFNSLRNCQTVNPHWLHHFTFSWNLCFHQYLLCFLFKKF
jgi:hypothetical protein